MTADPVPEHPHTSAHPSPWIMRHAARLQPGSQVLDLACGSGRHARALAALGCRVDAIDRDPQWMGSLKGVEGVRFDCQDLETEHWPVAADRYDAIVVANYLYRPRLLQLAASLRDGGLLLYETFAAGQERFGRPGNPDYLLSPFELARTFAPVLQVLAFEDGVVLAPAPARIQRLCAIRTDASRLDRLTLSGSV